MKLLLVADVNYTVMAIQGGGLQNGGERLINQEQNNRIC
jgi:hypothetical protein